ncbi:MAG TPA: imidazolonepropionase [Bacteroidales bacterium]|nr:imidazolonepropionase [Bacteroidales bacterium]HPK29732.1 imidazolonepropionase [Bacteroidales bacterium]
MSSLLIVNIGKLVQVREQTCSPLRGAQMDILPAIDDAFLFSEKGKIAAFGSMSELPQSFPRSADKVIDAAGRMVLPAFCDCHTHLVYAGSREMEFIDKIRGLSYQEIAARGGGILNSARLLHDTSEEELFRQAMVRVEEVMHFGTGAIEIKSGYGLTTEDEVKMLRVIRRIAEESPLTVKATFMGAHAFPERFRDDHEGYVSEIINEMIPAVAAEGLAEYIDVFCEEGFFSREESDRILAAGRKYGLKATVHANQMSCSGGVEVGVKYDAESVSHLEYAGDAQFEVLEKSETIANLLPGATFFLDMEYPDARRMLQHDIPVALATNYNPGSCPCGDMKFIMALACMKMKMTPEEVINAATINSAFAMGLGETHGSITLGKVASLIITRPIPSLEFIPYAFSTPLVENLILDEKIVI